MNGLLSVVFSCAFAVQMQGKTSFARCVLSLDAVADGTDAGRTRGVDMTVLPAVRRRARGRGGGAPPSCSVTMLDFGGHVEYASVQSAFVTSGCVIVVVVNVAAVVEEPRRCLDEVSSWVESAVCNSGDGRGTSGLVCVLGTHLDEVRRRGRSCVLVWWCSLHVT